MSAHGQRLDGIIAQAVTEGILPAGTIRPVQDSRPWPLILLTGLGAWLAALPLLLGVGLMLGSSFEHGAAVYLVGAILLGGAIAILRNSKLSLFVEQLAVPLLIVGGCLLGFGFGRDLPLRVAAVLIGLLALLVIWSIRQDWLRALLGALAAWTLGFACMPGSSQYYHFNTGMLWGGAHLCLLVWVAVLWLQHKALSDGRSAFEAAAVEATAAGWILGALSALAISSGMTFLAGASLGGEFSGDISGDINGEIGGEVAAQFYHYWRFGIAPTVSVVLAIAGALWLLRCWPSLRQSPAIGVALVLTVLAWFTPALGGAWLVLAICIASGRIRLAMAAALAAAWIIGSFYYQLTWPLATKALVMAGAGLMLGLLSWLAARGAVKTVVETAAGATPRPVKMAIGLSLLAVLLAANGGIWQKEDLIARGQPVFVALAPVDPRSLMQGDYMRLNFRLPGTELNANDDAAVETGYTPSTPHLRQGRAHLVAMRDAAGVATLIGWDNGRPLAAGQFLIETTFKRGSPILVTDAWYFKEGEAERWSHARYGEFRVMPDGRALLVGMRGEKLEKL